jgi:hypothetical protein
VLEWRLPWGCRHVWAWVCVRWFVRFISEYISQVCVRSFRVIISADWHPFAQCHGCRKSTSIWLKYMLNAN